MIAADYSTHPAHAALRPRAIALLVALRRGPRSTAQLADALGDACLAETNALLRDMKVWTVAAGRTIALTEDGVAWLETHGLVVRNSPFSLARVAS